jgi:3-hydroxyacyl-CoA dehydrogenase
MNKPENQVSTAPVRREQIGRVAVLTIHNPPVNALSQQVRRALADQFAAAMADPAVAAIVITGSKGSFIAGADIREFDGPVLEPGLASVLVAIDASEKPVVAAIGQVALGGGAEVALACHARIAANDASLGLPEVKLGIIPGAGGIPRLIRLADPATVLDLVASGRSIGAGHAKEVGMVDQVVPAAALLPAALRLAESLAGKPPRRISALPVHAGDSQAFEAASQRWAGRARGQDSIKAVVEAVRHAITSPFAAAVERDRQTFVALRASDQAVALRYLFFAERQALRIPGVDLKAARPVKTVAIIGAGTMGRGIAIACLKANLAVVLVDLDAKALERAKPGIAEGLARLARSEQTGEAETQAKFQRLSLASSLDAITSCDLIVEAVFEDEAVKRMAIAAIGNAARGDAVIVSNTSYLDIDRLAQACPAPNRFLGLHFFAPAEIMRLVEVIRGKASSPQSSATAIQFARTLGKASVPAGICDGFIVNRILSRYRREMERVLEEGALPADVDGALEQFGMAMGPFAVADLSGLDIGWARRKRLRASANPPPPFFPVADWLCEQGHFGRKSGSGWYRYVEGKRLPNDSVSALIERASAEHGVTRRPVAAAEIVERALAAMLLEAAAILEEGIALRASDIDFAIVNGLGFPAWRGGPLYHCDKRGLASMLQAAAARGEAVPPLLARLADAGKRISDYAATAIVTG